MRVFLTRILVTSVARSRSRSLPVAGRSQAVFLGKTTKTARSQQLLLRFFGRYRTQTRSQTIWLRRSVLLVFAFATVCCVAVLCHCCLRLLCAHHAHAHAVSLGLCLCACTTHMHMRAHMHIRMRVCGYTSVLSHVHASMQAHAFGTLFGHCWDTLGTLWGHL